MIDAFTDPTCHVDGQVEVFTQFACDDVQDPRTCPPKCKEQLSRVSTCMLVGKAVIII